MSTEHLEASEIESWAEGLLPAARALHLAECSQCLAQAERERQLFITLARLSHLSPSAGFGDRVMARVKIPQTSARPPKG